MNNSITYLYNIETDNKKKRVGPKTHSLFIANYDSSLTEDL